jgi:hypothetical protein
MLYNRVMLIITLVFYTAYSELRIPLKTLELGTGASVGLDNNQNVRGYAGTVYRNDQHRQPYAGFFGSV